MKKVERLRAVFRVVAAAAASLATANIGLAHGAAWTPEETVLSSLQRELAARSTVAGDRDLLRARVLARVACRRLALDGACEVQSISRQSLLPDVDVVSYTIQIGPDAEDVIVVRRAVSPDRAPGRDAVVLLKGIGGRWIELYFPAQFVDNVAEDFSPVVTLVRDGIDVWGIDYRWDQVPLETQEFDFMADWGLATTVDDTRFAMRFARYVRLLEGSGFARIVMAGYSAGVPLAYAVTSVDSQQPAISQDIRALLPIDGIFKIDPVDTGVQTFICSSLQFYEDLLDDGVFALGSDVIVEPAQLALDDPDGESPFDPALTNEQFLALLLSAPFSEEFPYHINGGDFDEAGKPFLLYGDIQGIALQITTYSPYFPVIYFRDTTEIACTDGVVGDFDRLADIDRPIFDVTAAGGYNGAGLYAASLTAGPIEQLKVGVLEEGEESIDWGHGDIFQVPGADALMFEPIAEWIRSLP